MTHHGLTLVKPWSNLKNLEPLLTWFIKRSGFQNHGCDWAANLQSWFLISLVLLTLR